MSDGGPSAGGGSANRTEPDHSTAASESQVANVDVADVDGDVEVSEVEVLVLPKVSCNHKTGKVIIVPEAVERPLTARRAGWVRALGVSELDLFSLVGCEHCARWA